MVARYSGSELLRLALALALVGVAFGVRLPAITSPAFDFAPARQTYDAMRARIIYLEGNKLPAWQEAVLRATRPDVPQIEPPVMENLAAAAYTVTGSERLWIARLISIVFWLTGSVFVYRIARRLAPGAIAPFVSLATYLLFPFGIAGSRSFQPDPLMIAATLGGVLAIVRFHERPTSRRLAAASLASALAMLVKPAIPIFFLWGAFFSLAVARRGIKRGVLSRDSSLFAVASFAPAGMYYVWGTFIDGFLRGHTESSVDPALWTNPDFWRGWRGMVANVVAYDNLTVTTSNSRILVVAVAALALAGVALAWTRQGAALLVGLWLGYVVFGLVFTAHVSTHLYYSLPLVPIIALSIAPLAGRMQSGLAGGPTAIRAVAIGLCMLAFAVLVTRTDKKLAADHRGQARMYEEIGAAVDHTTSAVHVDYLYTTPLLYYGWLHSVSLYDPYAEALRPGELERNLRQIQGESGPTRYLIVTALDQLDTRPELRALTRRLTLVQRTAAYAIYAFPRRTGA